MPSPAAKVLLLRPQSSYVPLTVSGNEITDALRAAATSGDGLLNDSSYGFWPAATNLCTNGGFQTNATGWTTGGTNTLASDAGQAKFGTKSGKATYVDNATLADYVVTITNVVHTVQARLWIPTDYDGAGIELRQLNFSVAASAVAANMATRNAWQQVVLTFTPGADVIGNIQVNNTGAAPTAGRFICIDGVQCEVGNVATPYIETDGATAARAAGRVQAPASLLNATQGAVAMRFRAGWAAASPPNSSPRAFAWNDGAGNLIEMRLGATAITVANDAAGGAAAETQATGTTFAAGDIVTLLAMWKAADLGVSYNGGDWSLKGSRSEIPVIATTTFEIGSLGAVMAGREINGDVLWAAFWDNKSAILSNSDAARIRAFGNNDPALSDLPGNPSGVFHAKNAFMEIRS